jgi:hypothetical protein
MYCIGAGSEAGVDDDGVVHRAVLLERLDDARDGRFLLADGDVDAHHRVLGAPVLLLVDDRVERDGGLAGLAVADDQFALPRPIGIIASTALMPVCSGSCTG